MKVNCLTKRQRNKNEVSSARIAIKNHCLECMGYDWNEVKECTSPGCWLYPWRLGRTPTELKRPARPMPEGFGFKKKTA